MTPSKRKASATKRANIKRAARVARPAGKSAAGKPVARKPIHVKVHERNAFGEVRRIVAACDSALLGKVFEGPNGRFLDLKVYRSFYEGEKVSQDELAEILSHAGNINLVGEKTIEAAVKAFPQAKAKPFMIGGVPHLQIYRV